MIDPASRYAFRPVETDDLGLLAEWLRVPAVVEWWGDPLEQAALLRADLDDFRMEMRIVAYDGRPFAYIQDYDVHAWPQPHLSALPPRSRGVDLFVGAPAMIGCGHGGALLRLRAQQLVAAGAPLVVTDPDPRNLRARRAYRRAGFRGETNVETADGAIVLMIFDPAASSAAVA